MAPCLTSVILSLMLCQGSRPSQISLPLMFSSSSQISIASALPRIRTILRSKVTYSKTVQGRSSSRAATCLHLNSRRVTTLTTTIFKIHCRIQVTMVKEAINSSRDLSNMTTLITQIWLPPQTTLIINSNRGDRVAAITMLERPPIAPAIITEVPQQQRSPKETKVYPLSTILHSQLRMMCLPLNLPILRQLQEYNKRAMYHKQRLLYSRTPPL